MKAEAVLRTPVYHLNSFSQIPFLMPPMTLVGLGTK